MGTVATTVPQVPCCQSQQVCEGKLASSVLPEDNLIQASTLSDTMAEEQIDGKIDTKLPVPVHYAHGSERSSSKMERHSSTKEARERHSAKKEAKKELASILRLRNFSSGLPSPTENGTDSMSLTPRSGSIRHKSSRQSYQKGRASTATSRTGQGSVAQPGSEEAAVVVATGIEKERQLQIRRSASTNSWLTRFAEMEMDAMPEGNGGDSKSELNTVYRGQWSGTARHGMGRQYWKDGAIYEGEWYNNKAHGRGRFEMTDGERYVGEWSMGAQDGQGTFWSRRYVYFGQWTAGLQDGHGVEISHQRKGSVQEFRYAGFFHKGLKQGAGVCRWADGGEYYGEWQGGVITGKGNHTNTKGHIYRGQWISSTKHGRGVHSWPDGRSFGGDYDYDEADGYGFYTWPDGRKDVGFWVDRLFFNKSKYSMADISNRIAQSRMRKSKAHVAGEEEGSVEADDSYSDVSMRGEEELARLTWAGSSPHGNFLEAHLAGSGSSACLSPAMPDCSPEYRHAFLQDFVSDAVQRRQQGESVQIRGESIRFQNPTDPSPSSPPNDSTGHTTAQDQAINRLHHEEVASPPRPPAAIGGGTYPSEGPDSSGFASDSPYVSTSQVDA